MGLEAGQRVEGFEADVTEETSLTVVDPAMGEVGRFQVESS